MAATSLFQRLYAYCSGGRQTFNSNPNYADTVGVVDTTPSSASRDVTPVSHVDGVGGPATDLTPTEELPAPITDRPPSDTGYMVTRHGRYTRRPALILVLRLAVSDDVNNSEGLKRDDVDVTLVVSHQSSSAPPGVRTSVPVAQADSDKRVEVLKNSILQMRQDNKVLHKYNKDLLRHNKPLQEIFTNNGR